MLRAVALAAIAIFTIDYAYGQSACPAGQAKLRDGEPCIPNHLRNYLYCLSQSGGGKVEVVKKEESTTSSRLEVTIGGKGSGVIIKGEGSGSVRKEEEARALKELSEKLDPSLTKNCKDLATAPRSAAPSAELQRMADAILQGKTATDSLRQDMQELKTLVVSALQRIEASANGQQGGILSVDGLAKGTDTPVLIAALVQERDKYKTDLLQRNREIAVIAYLSGDLGNAAKSATEVLKLEPDDLDALIVLANARWLSGGRADMESIFNRILAIARERDDLEAQAGAMANLAELYATNSGRTPEMSLRLTQSAKALEKQSFLRRSIPFYDPLPDHMPPLLKGNLLEYERFYLDWTNGKRPEKRDKAAEAYGYLGVIKLKVNDLDNAESYMLRSLEEYSSAPEDAASIVGKANQHSNLGIVFARRNDATQAKSHWQRALELYAQVRSPYFGRVQMWFSGRDSNGRVALQ